MVSKHTTIAVSKRTHELVRKQKRGGESFDDLLKKMVHQYEPEEVSH
jgi:predicted CopG family antitoxin